MHPVRLTLADDGRRSRLTVLFRPLLTLPHFAWLALWTAAAVPAAIANALVALVNGRSAEVLHRFLAAHVRYHAHVASFLFVVANPFPGFTGAEGYPVDVQLEPPQPQRRSVTLFRVVLGIPALLLAAVLTAALVLVGALGSLAALVTGRTPTGTRNFGAYAVRYLSQTNAYWLGLTDAYPDARRSGDSGAGP